MLSSAAWMWYLCRDDGPMICLTALVVAWCIGQTTFVYMPNSHYEGSMPQGCFICLLQHCDSTQRDIVEVRDIIVRHLPRGPCYDVGLHNFSRRVSLFLVSDYNYLTWTSSDSFTHTNTTHIQHTHSGLRLDVVAQPVRTIPNKLGSVCSFIICVTSLNYPHKFFLCVGGVERRGGWG